MPCLPGTRTAIHDAILKHLDSPSLRYVFLRGSPGTGKSAITMTLARELEKQNRLAASFFFDKRMAHDESSTLGMIVPSLARQISLVDSRYHEALTQALRANPDVVRDNVKLQVEELIVKPCLRAHSPTTVFPSAPSVLVFDSLDECGGSADLDTLLDLLIALDSLPPNYRILFSSRPQSAILRRFPFGSTGPGVVEDLDDPKYQAHVGDDIHQFVKTRFQHLGLDDPDPNWPPTLKEVREFSESSQGMFELASLRVRRIESAPANGLRPRRVFEIVMKEATRLPVKGLENGLEAEYLRIIAWAYSPQNPDLDETVKVYRRIVGTFVSLRQPLSLEALSQMLNMSEGDIRYALRPLSSVFFIDADSSALVRCYHSTFREFLSTIPLYSSDFHRKFLFNGPQHSSMLQLCVETLLRELRTGMLPETSDHDTLDDIDNLDSKVSIILPPYLRYCCLYWNYHLLLTHSDQYISAEAALGTLFGSCLLNWIEAMSLLRELDEAIPILWRTHMWYRSWVRRFS